MRRALRYSVKYARPIIYNHGTGAPFVTGCLLFYILYVLSNLYIEINHPNSLPLTSLHLDQFEPDEVVDGSLSNTTR